jgi:hypothetical protein
VHDVVEQIDGKMPSTFAALTGSVGCIDIPPFGVKKPTIATRMKTIPNTPASF